MKITLANGEQSASTDYLIIINKLIKLNKCKKQFQKKVSVKIQSHNLVYLFPVGLHLQVRCLLLAWLAFFPIIIILDYIFSSSHTMSKYTTEVLDNVCYLSSKTMAMTIIALTVKQKY